jgi:hypothetical protein
MAEASEIQSATDDDQSDVDALCVRTLIERIPHSNALSPLGTLFPGWFEKDYVSLSTLIGWMILISFFQAVTYWNTKRFLRYPPLKERLRDWRNWQIFWTGLEGMCWGSAAIFFHASGSSGSFNDVVVMMVIVTVVCLSIFPVAPSYPTFASFISGASAGVDSEDACCHRLVRRCTDREWRVYRRFAGSS